MKIGRLMNKDSITNSFMFAFAFVIFTNPSLAAGGLENLNKATDALQELTNWLYVFVGVGSVLYLIYLVCFTLLEKKQWTDVFIGLGHCSMAGGVVMAADWALVLFK
ncbi:conjugal transfer protein [Xenorhabdus bovienii]|uniref:conjugal transfer protein n=1 Tax=Xenorhabdus bovienii TaxID=40576 RepID=UPI0023B342EA|nr:conjugal transfer protein [Xenorhabdus bovienii]